MTMQRRMRRKRAHFDELFAVSLCVAVIVIALAYFGMIDKPIRTNALILLVAFLCCDIVFMNYATPIVIPAPHTRIPPALLMALAESTQIDAFAKEELAHALGESGELTFQMLADIGRKFGNQQEQMQRNSAYVESPGFLALMRFHKASDK